MAKRRATTPNTGRSIRKAREGAVRRQREEDERLAQQQPEIVRPATPDPLDYVPRDLDKMPRNKKVAEIFRKEGYTKWRDVFVDWDQVTTGNVDSDYRMHIYLTPEEAVLDYGDERGILSYIKILYHYPTDTYRVLVDYQP